MPCPRHPLHLVMAFLCLTLAACTGGLGGSKDGRVVNGPAGNAEGYNGGDADDLKLRIARRKAFVRMSDVSKNLLPSRLCRYSECAQRGTPWCEALHQLTAEQEQSCQEFVVQTLPELFKLDQITVKLSESDLSVGQHGGRAVDATTDLGPVGSITFARSSVRRLYSEEIQVVMIHELGHKVSWRGAYVADDIAIGGFPSGRELLDTAAAALMVYSQTTALQGFFRHGTTGYFGNTIGHYCALANWQDWLRAGGPSDASQAPEYAAIPSLMEFDGTCNIPQPATVQGFFRHGVTGFYGNNIAQYCALSSWEDWLRAGGPSDATQTPDISVIPSAMVFMGTCQIP